MTLTTISLNKETKEEMDKLKLCREESYNSLLTRVLPRWMSVINNELNKERTKSPPLANEQTTDNN